MFTLTQVTQIFGDCTAGYRVDLDKEYTVSEFINEVLREKTNEWGSFEIKRFMLKAEYRHGEIIESDFDENILSAKILSVAATGGWSRMDYIIII